MSVHKFSDHQFTSRVQAIFNSLKSSEDDLHLVTNDGHILAANQSLLLLRSTLLSALIGQLQCGQTAAISVDAPAKHVGALLNFINDGETTFENVEMLEDVRILAKSIGINLADIDTRMCKRDEPSSGHNMQEIRTDTEDIYYKENRIESNEMPADKINHVINHKMPNESNENQVMECNLCLKMFKSRSKFRVHKMCHTNFNCSFCHKGFRFATLLRGHISSNHEIVKKPYFAEEEGVYISEKFITEAEALYDHIGSTILHKQVNNETIELSGNNIENNRTNLTYLLLEEHIETKYIELEEQTSEVDIKFEMEENMTKFDFYETNTKKFECNLCTKLFKSKSKLRFHLACHTSFTCTLCEKGFRFSTLQRRHMSSCHVMVNDDNIDKIPVENIENIPSEAKDATRELIENVEATSTIEFSKDFLSQNSLLV